MLRILILLVLFLNLNAVNFTNITLTKFVKIVSNVSNINIVISDSVDKNFHIFLPNYNIDSKRMNLKILENILSVNDLSYRFVSNIFLIFKKKAIQTKPDFKSYVIKYTYLNKSDLLTFLKLYPTLKFSILKGRIFLITTKNKYLQISHQIHLLDSSYLQRKINLLIISTDNNKLNDTGLDFKALYKNASKYVSLITSTVNFTTSLSDPLQFYSFINYLHNKGYTHLLDSPSLSLFDKKNAYISSTTNIPFLVSTTSTQDSRTIVQNSYKYKDVGLKISFKNVVVTKKFVDFDIDIFIQSVLDKSITPVTSSKHLQTHLTLYRHSSYIIGGLNSNDKYSYISSIPVIKYIPILSQLTTHKKESKKNETFTIVISSN